MTTMSTISSAASLFRSTATSLADSLASAVVEVRNQNNGSGGAGLIWGGSGLVVTNAHCVPRGAAIEVGSAGRWRETRVVGYHPPHDLALLETRWTGGRVDGWTGIREAASLRAGELLFALGHPLGVRDSLAMGVLHADVARDRRTGQPGDVDHAWPTASGAMVQDRVWQARRVTRAGVTRIAIVAASEELRARLAAALATDPTFEVVAVGAAPGDVAPSADVVLVARDAEDSSPRAHDDAGTAGQGGASLTNREREILALLADGLRQQADRGAARHLDEHGEDASRAVVREDRCLVACRGRWRPGYGEGCCCSRLPQPAFPLSGQLMARVPPA